MVLQHQPVRASTRSYPRFTLAMDSSLGFGSTPSDSQPYGCTPCSDLLSLRLRTAPVLNLATQSNSPAHSSIGTPSLRPQPRALTACQRTVSGSLSLPARGAFHLSLTVLVHYRSRQVFSLGKWSPLLPTGFLVSGGTQERRHPAQHLRRRDSHPLWSAFPEPFV